MKTARPRRASRAADMMPESAFGPALPPLGDVGVARFMRDHWQRRPLLIRQAIPGFQPLLSQEALRALALRDDVESRVVSAFGGRWKLARGPFEPDELPSPRRKAWTCTSIRCMRCCSASASSATPAWTT